MAGGLTNITVNKRWKDGAAYFESYVDALKTAIETASNLTNKNLNQLRADLFYSDYTYTNDGVAGLGSSLQAQINLLASGGVPLTGTTSNTFVIRSASNSLTISASSLTGSITTTYPNTGGEVVIDSATQTLSGKSFTGNTTFDTDVFYIDGTNDRTYFGSATSYSINSQSYQRQILLTASGLCDSKKFVDNGSNGIVDSLFVDSASPAVSDTLHDEQLYGRSSAGTLRLYGRKSFLIKSPTNGAEEGRYLLALMRSGTSTNILDLDSTGNTIAGNTTIIGSLSLPDTDPPVANQMYRNSGVKGYAAVGSTGVESESWNVSATSRTSDPGQYSVTWDTDFSASTYSVVAMSVQSASSYAICSALRVAGSISLNTYDVTVTLQNRQFSVIAIGDQ